MSEPSMARVRSADPVGRMALVELDGSEGTAVWVPLGDGVHRQTVQLGAECVVALAPGGDRTVLCTTGHDPQRASLAGVSSAATPAASFAYTDGTTCQNALSVDVPTLGACQVWATGWLALRAAVAVATPVWELRVLVEGAGAGPGVGWGSALASLRQVCVLTASVPVPDAGTWRVRLQVRPLVSGQSVTCSGGLLLAEARAAP